MSANDLWQLKTGAGNDTVGIYGRIVPVAAAGFSALSAQEEISAEVYLGAGDDTLLNAGSGCVVHGGEGNDRLSLSTTC